MPEPAGETDGHLRLWLTGAEGMLGHAFQTILSELGLSFIPTDLELDITDRGDVLAFAARQRPTHIVNCAAFTAVEDAEVRQRRAHAVNAQGAGNLWLAALETGATLIHLSTNYVFDGSALEPYGEHEMCSPSGAYGRSKRAGEQWILDRPPPSGSSARSYIVRSSWVYGPHGENFVDRTLRLSSEQEELRVVADGIGAPTYSLDLARAALALPGLAPAVRPLDEDWGVPTRGEPARPRPPGLYHFANGGATSWLGFTAEILKQARHLGLPVRTTSVVPVHSQDAPGAAPRPGFSVLDTSKIEDALGASARPWQEALSEYLETIQQGVASR